MNKYTEVSPDSSVDEIAQALIKYFNNDLPMDINKINAVLKKWEILDTKKQKASIKKALALIMK